MSSADPSDVAQHTPRGCGVVAGAEECKCYRARFEPCRATNSGVCWRVMHNETPGCGAKCLEVAG